jgi:hypothetical protein
MFIIIIHEGRWIFIYSHIKLIHKKSVLNIGTKVYNKLPGYIKELDSYKAFKKELKLFFFTPFTRWKNLYLCNYVTYNFKSL